MLANVRCVAVASGFMCPGCLFLLVSLVTHPFGVRRPPIAGESLESELVILFSLFFACSLATSKVVAPFACSFCLSEETLSETCFCSVTVRVFFPNLSYMIRFYLQFFTFQFVALVSFSPVAACKLILLLLFWGGNFIFWIEMVVFPSFLLAELYILNFDSLIAAHCN